MNRMRALFCDVMRTGGLLRGLLFLRCGGLRRKCGGNRQASGNRRDHQEDADRTNPLQILPAFT